MIQVEPYLIEFSKIGRPDLGYISVAEKELLFFDVKRVYWTYYTPQEIVRGGHAHYLLEQILISVAGTIIVKTETLTAGKNEFILDRPNVGLFMPKMCWHEMQYTHNAAQMCIANYAYSEDDYIRDYSKFINQK